MSIGLVFWILMILWAVFGICPTWPVSAQNRGAYVPFGGSILLFVLLFLLGWRTFGFVIQG